MRGSRRRVILGIALITILILGVDSALGVTTISNTIISGVTAFISSAADPADAGVLRLGNAETVCWEASPAPANDICIQTDANEDILFGTDTNNINLNSNPLTNVILGGSIDMQNFAMNDIANAVKSAAATLTLDEEIIFLNPSTTAFTITLPTAVGNDGKHYRLIYASDTGTVVTIDGNGAETINGQTTVLMEYADSAFDLYSDGSNWFGIYADSILPREKYFTITDDFFGGDAEAGEIGNYGWNEVGVGTETFAQIDGELDHAGIWNFATGAISGDDIDVWLGDTGTLNAFDSDNTFSVSFIVRIPTITSITVRVGTALNTAANSIETNENAVFLFDPATSANWRCRTRSSGGTDQSTTTSVAVVASTWYKLKVLKDSGTIRFLIDDVNVCNHATQIPTGALSPVMSVDTTSAASRNIQADWFYARVRMNR